MNLPSSLAHSNRRTNSPISPTWRGSKPRAPAPIMRPTRPHSAPASWRSLMRRRCPVCASICILRWKSSARRIRSFTIWAMNSGAQKLEPIEAWTAEDALIVRPYLDVEVRLLPPGGAAFLRALAEGRSLGAAADAAFADDAAFDLTGSLAALIGGELAIGCTPSEPNERAHIMSDTAPAAGTPASGLAGVIQRILAALDRIPYWLIALAARVFPAAIFWQSGQTKVSGLHLKPERDHPLCQRVPAADHRPDSSRLPVGVQRASSPGIPCARACSTLCRFRPVVHDGGDRNLRLFGRLANDGVWATCFFLLIARGPGEISIDHLIARHFRLAHGRRR